MMTPGPQVAARLGRSFIPGTRSGLPVEECLSPVSVLRVPRFEAGLPLRPAETPGSPLQWVSGSLRRAVTLS